MGPPRLRPGTMLTPPKDADSRKRKLVAQEEESRKQSKREDAGTKAAETKAAATKAAETKGAETKAADTKTQKPAATTAATSLLPVPGHQLVAS